MEPIDQEYDSIRGYLLGQLSGEEQQRLEERFMTDGEYREEVLIGEEDLIDDYLSGNLSVEERKAFETHWLPFHSDRLDIAQELTRYCTEPAPVEVAPMQQPTEIQPPGRVLTSEKFHRRPVVIGALAAGFLFLILGGAWLFFRQPESRARFNEELARLNQSANGSAVPEKAVALSPVTLRGAEAPKINPGEHGPVVALLLKLPPDQHSSYQVILRSTNRPEEYTVENLEAVSTSVGRAVLLKVPSALLVPGHYSLEVRGGTPEGSFESIADYSLQASN